jgi:hypothetical protein
LPTSASRTTTIYALNFDNAGTYTWALQVGGTGQVNVLNNATSAGAAGGTVEVEDGWCIIGFTRPAGAAQTVRGHLFKSGAWTHFNFPTTLNNGGSTPTQVRFGSYLGSVAGAEFEIAVAAVWDSELSDGNIETLDNNTSTTDWYDLSPTALWEYGQAAVTTDVTDLTGNGANQTSRTGTDVVDHGPTTWDYGVSSTVTAVPASATADGAAPTPQISVTAAVASATASAAAPTVTTGAGGEVLIRHGGMIYPALPERK